MTQTVAHTGAAAPGGQGATRQLAHHAATLTFEALPPELVALTRRCILDTLGVAIGASGLAEEGRILVDYVREQGGRAESTLLGFGGRVPAPGAALVNGSLAHWLDYDDISGSHVSIATVPVAFAVAEKVGGVSGRNLITAVAVGIDLMERLNGATSIPDWPSSEGWFGTQLLGYMAGAATAGRLLGLDPDRMENALGIGFNQCSGSRQMAIGAPTHMRAMQAGFSGQGAVVAAEMAQRGLIGTKEALEGRYGLFNSYLRDPSPNWEFLLGGLGSHFPVLRSHGFKVWPACAHARPVTAAILHLRETHCIAPEEVEALVVSGGPPAIQLLSEPLEARRRPTMDIDGKFSIPFTAAVAMVRGTVALGDYTPEGLRDPAVLAMADRVSYRPPAAGEERGARPTVEITLRDGRTYAHRVTSVPGDPAEPVPQSVLEAKFRECMSFSARPVSPERTAQAVALIGALDEAPDATEVVRLLT